MSGAVCGESRTYRSNREGRRVIPPLDSTVYAISFKQTPLPSGEAHDVKGGDRGDPPSREIGKLSQIQQSEVSHLMNGRFKRFSEGKL